MRVSRRRHSGRRHGAARQVQLSRNRVKVDRPMGAKGGRSREAGTRGTIATRAVGLVLGVSQQTGRTRMAGAVYAAVFLFGIVVNVVAGAPAFAASILPAPALPPGMLVPVVRIGPESRLTFSQYAAENGFSAGKLEQRYAATGLLRCNGSVGTAQLTAARDVITTA